MRITEQHLATLNRRYEGASPEEILRVVREIFGDRSAILSSMQRAGTALCFLAERAGLSFDVLFVDTGVLHAETLATRDELAKTHRNCRIITLRPERSFADQTREEGVLYLTREGQERCCELRKTAPLLSTRGRYDALIGALRRAEGGARSRVRIFDLDPEMNALRVHPLAAMSAFDFDALQQAAPVVNPLHAMGFPTIGCFPCTTPVRADEPERAGRWRHLAGVEYCGINPIDRGGGGGGGGDEGGDERAVDLDDRYASLLAI